MKCRQKEAEEILFIEPLFGRLCAGKFINVSPLVHNGHYTACMAKISILK